MRRAKIVCTIGPATSSPETLRALIDAGMNVARLNFSHGTHEQHGEVISRLRTVSKEADRPLGILADLQGPKIRLGSFREGSAEWPTGAEVTLTGEEIVGSGLRVGVTYPRLADEVLPGDTLLVNDGAIELQAESISGRDVHARVLKGGPVSDHKGLSLPGVQLSIPSLTEKDHSDLTFALQHEVDWIALSFVRSPQDVQLVRAVMDECGIHRPVLAKIEKPEALECLEQIVLAFDGLMVARGDLGVEMPLEAVPLVQKRAVQLARENARPVVVATQMLESMIDNPRPTRAEASDVANAVLDGADALMLSGETSVGSYPVDTVATMSRVIEATERGAEGQVSVPSLEHAPRTKGGSIAAAASQIGHVLGAQALVPFTWSGDTARRLSRLHSELPLYAFTPRESVHNQLTLSWGVQPFLTPQVEHTDEMVQQVDQLLREHGVAAVGEFVVVVAGSPPNTTGSTNALRIHEIGSIGE